MPCSHAVLVHFANSRWQVQMWSALTFSLADQFFLPFDGSVDARVRSERDPVSQSALARKTRSAVLWYCCG